MGVGGAWWLRPGGEPRRIRKIAAKRLLPFGVAGERIVDGGGG